MSIQENVSNEENFPRKIRQVSEKEYIENLSTKNVSVKLKSPITSTTTSEKSSSFYTSPSFRSITSSYSTCNCSHCKEVKSNNTTINSSFEVKLKEKSISPSSNSSDLSSTKIKDNTEFPAKIFRNSVTQKIEKKNIPIIKNSLPSSDETKTSDIDSRTSGHHKDCLDDSNCSTSEEKISSCDCYHCKNKHNVHNNSQNTLHEYHSNRLREIKNKNDIPFQSNSKQRPLPQPEGFFEKCTDCRELCPLKSSTTAGYNKNCEFDYGPYYIEQAATKQCQIQYWDGHYYIPYKNESVWWRKSPTYGCFFPIDPNRVCYDRKGNIICPPKFLCDNEKPHGPLICNTPGVAVTLPWKRCCKAKKLPKRPPKCCNYDTEYDLLPDREKQIQQQIEKKQILTDTAPYDYYYGFDANTDFVPNATHRYPRVLNNGLIVN